MNSLLLIIAPIRSFLVLARALPAAGWRPLPKRLLLFTLLWLAQVVLNVLHLLGFMLDAVLFSAYRRVEVDRPIFIVGVPRSGTTFLQRLLARDPQLTSLTTWECILAPSITERRVYVAFARLLRPMRGLLNRLPFTGLRSMESIHSIGLAEPEEDFLLLWSINACFLLSLMAPTSNAAWRLGHFDEQISDWWQRLVMNYYRSCVRRHLYFHGSDKRYLSKNPSFTSLTHNLMRLFPDCRLVGCTRHPDKAIASQFSALKPGIRLLARPSAMALIRDPLLNVLDGYYGRLTELAEAGNCLLIEQTDLKQNLMREVIAIFRYAGLTLSADMKTRVEQESADSREQQSQHRYTAASVVDDDRYSGYHFLDNWARHCELRRREAQT